MPDSQIGAKNTTMNKKPPTLGYLLLVQGESL